MRNTLNLKPLLLLLVLSNSLLASQAITELKSELIKESVSPEEMVQISDKLSSIIENTKSKTSDKKTAIDLIGKFRLNRCLSVLLNNIEWIPDNIIEDKSSFEIFYPCIGAIVKIGEPSIPKLTQAIGKESNDLRLRLMGYAVMKIKSKEGALKHFDECLASEITEAQRECFNAAKVEVNKWHDKKQEAPQE